LALLIGEGQVGRVALSGFEWSEPVSVPKSAARVVLVGKQWANRNNKGAGSGTNQDGNKWGKPSN
jgi:hypothetical protein